MSWRVAAYRAARPLLFLADPESIHHLALRLLRRQATHAAAALCALARASTDPSGAGRAHGASIPQPDRARRGLRQGRRGHPWLGGARLRLRRAGHRHPAPAARQPAATPLPPARRRGAHQPHGLQQRRGRCARRAGSPRRGRACRPDSSSASTSAAIATANLGRLRHAAAGRVAPSRGLPRASTSAARTRRGCGTSRTRAPRSSSSVAVAEAAPGRRCSSSCRPISMRRRARRDPRRARRAVPGAGVILSNTHRHATGCVVAASRPEEGGLSGRPLLDRMVATVGGRAVAGLAVIASGGHRLGGDDASGAARRRRRPRPALDGHDLRRARAHRRGRARDLRHRASAWETANRDAC